MSKTKLYAYYFPNWHVDPKNEKWHGIGWTEWRCVHYAIPRYEGHVQPKKPLWGYEDESDPKVMEKKIETAKKYGIDGFIFDWYWHTDGPYRRKCLDEGFLKASNNEEMDFAVMWCNHTAANLHPTPYMGGAPLAYSTASKEFFQELTQFAIDNYFGKPNYIKIDGKPYFSIYLTYHFIKEAGLEETKEIFDDFRRRTKAAGFKDVHINAVNKFFYPGEGTLPQEKVDELCDYIGIDSLSYHGNDIPCDNTEVTFEYGDIKNLYDDRFERDAKSKYNVVPSVMLGYDNSPRIAATDMFEPSNRYPFVSISDNITPEKIGEAIKKTYDLTQKYKNNMDMIFLNSWNEWTETAFLEPCEEFGYGKLEEVKKVKDYIESVEK